MVLRFYENKKVFVTGHTGFKGSWLAKWLVTLGAKVKGYALEPIYDKNHIDLIEKDFESDLLDIRDSDSLKKSINSFKPDIIFHLAAQPLVRYSYENPIETYSTNVMGTLNLFEAARSCESVKAIVNVTSDKCYENKEWIWPYRETDPLGGYDPYSSSKACSEILSSSYRNSFFNIDDYGKRHNCLLSSVRAGNVIGGGDWATDRIIPDLIRSTESKKPVEIRSPGSIRPWQHVLDPLYGYLALGVELLNGKKQFATAFNFGPADTSFVPVGDLAKASTRVWDKIEFRSPQNTNQLHEAKLLTLDSSKAKRLLNWKPNWEFAETIEKTISWYRAFYEADRINTAEDISQYMRKVNQ